MRGGRGLGRVVGMVVGRVMGEVGRWAGDGFTEKREVLLR